MTRNPLITSAFVLTLLILAAGTAWGQTTSDSSAFRATASDQATPELSTEAQAAISSHIERDLYGVKPSRVGQPAGGPLAGGNPAQSYSTRFTSQGIFVHPRGTDAELGMTLTGWGYGKQLTPVDVAVPQADGRRVKLVRGALTEWYVNRASGLEQGFTLNAPPPGERGKEHLRLEIALSGSLVAEACNGAIRFRDADGNNRLHYGGLKAWDANGRVLAAEMNVAGNVLGLEVDDALAVYPVTVDPTIINETAKFKPSDGAMGDEFGISMALSGDLAVVGAYAGDDNGGNSGVAYVFKIDGATVTEIGKLLPSDGSAGDIFGVAVAASGNRAVIGAPLSDLYGSGSGAAYVFDLTPFATATPPFIANEIARLRPTDINVGTNGVGDGFGGRLAMDGSIAVVRSNDDVKGADAGAVYAFDLTTATGGATVAQFAKLLGSNSNVADLVGNFVSIEGTWVVAGAVRHDDLTAGADSGGAYAFDLTVTPDASPPFNLFETYELLPSDLAATDNFGQSSAVSGTKVIVTSVRGNGNVADTGSAYLFELTGPPGILNESAKLIASDGAAGDNFGGGGAAFDGTTALIGARLDDNANGTNAGSVYVFDLTGASGVVTEIGKLLPTDGAADDQFGFEIGTIAFDGGRILVGAHYDDDNGSNSGSVYLFTLAPSDLPPTADAGMDQSISHNTTVNLTGGGMDDITDAADFDYLWTLTQRPALSTAALSDVTARNPSFFADEPGQYKATLTVTDEGGNASLVADEVVICSTNVAPTADAGSDVLVAVNTPVALDGSGSSDPEMDTITYSWTLFSTPVGSNAALVVGANPATPSLTPDLAGDYVINLVVTDQYSASSVVDTVTITAIPANDFAQLQLEQACGLLAGLSTSQFDAKGHKKSMQNRCAQIAKFLQKNQTAQAKDKLQILISRLDGVALRNAVDPKGKGQPHAADFITDAAAQAPIYAPLTAALGVLP